MEVAAEASTEVIRRTEITTATEVNKGTSLFEIWNRSGFCSLFFEEVRIRKKYSGSKRPLIRNKEFKHFSPKKF